MLCGAIPPRFTNQININRSTWNTKQIIMVKFYDYLQTLETSVIEGMYTLVFGNHIEHYIDMSRGQMIEEICDEIFYQKH